MMSGWKDDYEKLNEGVTGKSPEGVSEKEFMVMLKLSNFFDDPSKPKVFRSKNEIARIFTGKSPDDMTKNVVNKMVDRRFIRVNNDNVLEFDEESFDDWVHNESNNGLVIWHYFDRHATYFKIK